MSPRRRLDPKFRGVTEKAYQRRIEVHARHRGWLTCHVRRAIVANGRFITPTSDAGFPDLWCLRAGQLVVFEVKREDAPASAVKPAQRKWLTRLATVAGVEAFVVRPSDWGEVEALLDEPPPPDTPPASALGLPPDPFQPEAPTP